ncbi:hypothetical protein AGR5A_pb0109 [Agrobacterium genomosp. 5 str. CFBP 6626]|nr:hypothetical protein AGR5A_pb0109 [Agrobacterium genomosp. 5 str. CFBP 6626]
MGIFDPTLSRLREDERSKSSIS